MSAPTWAWRSRSSWAITSRTVWPGGIGGIGLPATCSGPMRPPWVSTNESQIAWSSHVATGAGAGHAVALVRHAVAGPQVLGRVHVVDRRQHLAVQTLDVVRLGEAVGHDLPVRPHRRAGGHLAAELVEPRPPGIVRDALEVLGQRHRHQRRGSRRRAAPRCRPRTGTRPSASVSRCAESPARGHLAQRALQVPGPAVERAAQLGAARAGALAEAVAAVAAHVLERAELRRRRRAPRWRSTNRIAARRRRRAATRGRACRRSARRAATAARVRARRTPGRCSGTPGTRTGDSPGVPMAVAEGSASTPRVMPP